MNGRFAGARVIGTAAHGVLAHVFRRPAANFPGKLGLYVDPQFIAHLKTKLREGSVAIVGTNGKTTVTNILADALEAAGKTVACNRTGANLDSGVATALLEAHDADWGIFECDELWLPHVAEQLKPDYIVLLNLFRDQLDRAGEIEHVRQSIVSALLSCPGATLVYNADDPFCQAVADRVGNANVPFGIGEDLQLDTNTVADSGLCQCCDSLLSYDWRQYGQLGKYRCPSCGFAREEPHYFAHEVLMENEGASFSLAHPSSTEMSDAAPRPTDQPHPARACTTHRIRTSLAGAYSLYNLVASCAAADCCGVPFPCIKTSIESFSPENGRLQAYDVDGRRILLNLAKNPTGFNQNLRIVTGDPGPTAVAFFINDKEADGHDVSWLWDVDFQELAGARNVIAFAGGTRRNDMQVRLKYAGVNSQLVDSAEDFLAQARALQPQGSFYLIANYTALPAVKAELDRMRHLPAPATRKPAAPVEPRRGMALVGERVVIAHLYPELLNLYGDGGNVTVLAERARQRGIQVDIMNVEHGQDLDLSSVDIAFLGGGPDREQRLASVQLLKHSETMRAYVENDGVLLAICGGYQILGREWLLGDETVPGLGILGIRTKRATGGSHNRLVGNVALASRLATLPVVGYENHAGRTFLDDSVQAFGHIIGKHGHGNNDSDGVDGAVYRNVVGTYLHGPLLAKNPEIADWLLQRALDRRAAARGCAAVTLPPLDDTAENDANKHLCTMLGIR